MGIIVTNANCSSWSWLATVNDRIYVIGDGVALGSSVNGLNESYYNANYIPEFGSFTFLMLILSLTIIFGIFRIQRKIL